MWVFDVDQGTSFSIICSPSTVIFEMLFDNPPDRFAWDVVTAPSFSTSITYPLYKVPTALAVMVTTAPEEVAE